MENKAIAQEIQERIKNLKLIDQVEILANVITFIGASKLEAPIPINRNNIAEIVLEDRRRNGETLANALALQGVTMLIWLDKVNSTRENNE